MALVSNPVQVDNGGVLLLTGGNLVRLDVKIRKKLGMFCHSACLEVVLLAVVTSGGDVYQLL